VSLITCPLWNDTWRVEGLPLRLIGRSMVVFCVMAGDAVYRADE